MRIKVVTGFRKDQVFSVPMEEAHKVYYLFLNPEARTVLSTGHALRGSDIQRIEPDFQGSMGWNEGHALDTDDMNEIRQSGMERKLRETMRLASDAARVAVPADWNLTLSEIVKKYPALEAPARREGGVKAIGEFKPTI